MTTRHWWWLAAGATALAVYSVYRGSHGIPGGLAEGRSPSEFDPAQLRAGIEVEREHTNDTAIAREIAMDHLVEDPHYYDKLEAAGL